MILLYFYLNCHPLLQLDVHDLSKACAIIPVVYLCLLFSVPESPIFYLTKGNIIKARWSLKYFRRPFVQVDQELIAMQESLAKVQATNINLHNLTIVYEVISKQQFFSYRLKEKEFQSRKPSKLHQPSVVYS